MNQLTGSIIVESRPNHIIGKLTRGTKMGFGRQRIVLVSVLLEEFHSQSNRE